VLPSVQRKSWSEPILTRSRRKQRSTAPPAIPFPNGSRSRQLRSSMPLPSTIRRRRLSEFLSYLETERNCSISTRNHRLHCIRAFFKYAAQEDITVIAHLEEIQKVKRAKQPETIVEHMSEDAVQAILKQPDTYTEKGKRDAFLLLFLYKTGARVQELVDIRLCDIQL